MDAHLFYLWLEEKSQGPYTVENLREMMSKKQISLQTLYALAKDSRDWQPLASAAWMMTPETPAPDEGETIPEEKAAMPDFVAGSFGALFIIGSMVLGLITWAESSLIMGIIAIVFFISGLLLFILQELREIKFYMRRE